MVEEEGLLRGSNQERTTSADSTDQLSVDTFEVDPGQMFDSHRAPAASTAFSSLETDLPLEFGAGSDEPSSFIDSTEEDLFKVDSCPRDYTYSNSRAREDLSPNLPEVTKVRALSVPVGRDESTSRPVSKRIPIMPRPSVQSNPSTEVEDFPPPKKSRNVKNKYLTMADIEDKIKDQLPEISFLCFDGPRPEGQALDRVRQGLTELEQRFSKKLPPLETDEEVLTTFEKLYGDKLKACVEMMTTPTTKTPNLRNIFWAPETLNPDKFWYFFIKKTELESFPEIKFFGAEGVSHAGTTGFSGMPYYPTDRIKEGRQAQKFGS